MHKGREACNEVISDTLWESFGLDNVKHCDYLNISTCAYTDTNEFDVVVFNPSYNTWPRIIEIPGLIKMFDMLFFIIIGS